ncbi:hypothetical protein [Pseudomonas sp. LBUM920]|uniref:hypothetical protein n=1 Tax=Pseudomonas sp. LBUM920 TaxID=2126069 RepID=UPI000F57325A|nr:hypothetical protein [Pseudomonas sp. LBUM920]AZF62633.1 hypothetical protein C4J83_1630 [Pseudomonas sp. LBUM920]
MSKPNYKIIVGLWITAFILTLAAPITAGIFKQPEIAISTLIIGIFLTLVMILDLKQDRVMKGLFIILFGVLFQQLYLKLIYIFIPINTIPDNYKDYLDIYSQVLLFACSGAGGSIIAVHADKSSLDYESPSTNGKHNCQNMELKNITRSIEKMEKKFNLVIVTTASSALVFLILTIVVLVR